MDVNSDNFWELLPNIMLIIACSDYVALDMEMTGIQLKGTMSRDSMTVEQVYGHAKAAASTFQAVQIGMTCLRWTGSNYQSFTFTIPISPMFAVDSKEARRMAEVVDRQLTLSYSSLLFLQGQGFEFSKTLGQGVPYIGRAEVEQVTEQLLQDKVYERVNPSSHGQIAENFYSKLTKELAEWLEKSPSEGAVFRIFDPYGGTIRRSTIQMVIQLVREDFPTCRCWRDGDGWAMNVQVRDVSAENKLKEDTEQTTKEAIGKQFGVALIIEALLGDSRLKSYTERGFSFPLCEIDHCIASSLDLDATDWPCDPKFHWEEIIRKLDRRKPVLVGHSILYDLCFLHTMFIRELPDELGNFAQRIHSLLPRIVDNKLLVSQTVNPDVMDQKLSDLFKDLGSQSYPFIGSVVGWCYNKHLHSHQGRAHNAGFDSYMTAEIFLKLATRQMHLQQYHLGTQHQTKSSPSHKWESRWLEDPDKGDPYLQSLHRPESSSLPSFKSSFFEPVRNKLRMSNAGIVDLEKGHLTVRPATGQLTERLTPVDPGQDDILIKLKGQMDRLQTLIGNRVGGEAVEDIQDLCETLGCLRDELGKGHRH